MIKLELMDFSDYVRTDDIVSEIILQNPKIKIPIPLEEVAVAAGIIDIQYLKLGALEGSLTADPCKTKGVIMVNNDPAKGNSHRQRFTLGHELGHFMHPFHKSKMACSRSDINASKSGDIFEKQASDFSSKLLMPKKQFCNNQFFNDDASIRNVIKLAELFGVSFEACMNRYVETHHEPLRVLYFKDKQFRYFRYNNNLPFYLSQKFSKGCFAPHGSLTSQIDLKHQDYNYEDLVNASTWFTPRDGFIFPENIIEDVYIQTNGYSATLLKFECEIEEVE